MLRIITITFGVLAALMAIFANQLGIDNDADWGSTRTLLLEIGIAFVGLGVAMQVLQAPVQRLRSKWTIERWTAIRLIFVFTVILTAVAYLWFIRFEERDTSRSYNYYSELARSFKQGRLSLTDTPSPALLALSNPYDYGLRKLAGVEDFPWDVSLYDGKFYIYWGAAPALFLMPFSDDFLSTIEDHHLALAFAFGLFIYSALIVSSFWCERKNAPLWVYAVSLLVLGFSIPSTTMLNGANVYETAIFACQFFFIGGCFWAFIAIKDPSPQAWKFALAGVHWALAFGSRFTILPALAFAGLILTYPFFTGLRNGEWKKKLPSLIAIATPLLFGGLLIALYNWARFGSMFEFGVRYQLANVDYTQFSGSFSLQYLFKNLNTYLLHPIQIGDRFPFLSLVEYTGSNDRLSGLLYVSPFFLLLIYPLIRSLFIKKSLSTSDSPIILLFAGAAVTSASLIFTFYFVTLRYTLDFMPALLILTILLLGREFDLLYNTQPALGMLSVLFGLLAFANIATGTLLAVPEGGVLFVIDLLNSVSKLLGIR